VAFLSPNLKKLLLFSKPISLVGEIVFPSPSNQWKVQIKKFWMVVGELNFCGMSDEILKLL
jgi:hypothetical protein